VHAIALQPANISELAQKRFLAEERRPLMFSDWTNAAFIHFAVDPQFLQPQIPFALDLFEGNAVVSVVAFSIRRLRPVIGGRVSELLFQPIGNHEFFNVRTYVNNGNRAGIFFMAEWLNNRLSVALGPRSYGLPYRFGQLKYDHALVRDGELSGTATTSLGNFTYHAQPLVEELGTCGHGTLDEFLLERYTAFTWRRGVGRYFQIWHEPWPMLPLKVELTNDELLNATGKWITNATLIGGHYSPGVRNIWMSAPHRIGAK
jgi:uncharacterized protein